MSTNHPRLQEIVTALNLHRHPEGGWFSEVYRSATQVQALADARSARSALTSIYFLLAADDFSGWHRVRSCENWVHLEGQPLDLWTWDEHVNLAHCTPLGPLSGHTRPQHTVRAGLWQAAQPQRERDGCGFSLVACQVAPGFEFDDFEMMTPGSPGAVRLAHSWPQLAAFVRP